MEPAAMLVRALEIQVGRPGESLAALLRAQHAQVGRARVEPHVERVANLLVLRGLGAEQFRGIESEPRLDAGLLHPLRHLLEQLGGARMQFAGFLVQEERNRHAPTALARDAPVGPVGDHRL